MLRTAAAGALVGAAGCTPITPPPDDNLCHLPFDSVDWVPDVGHPVLWGEEHVTPADGAPREMAIYYPSSRLFPPAPMLRLCGTPIPERWPIALFLHGMPPAGVSLQSKDAYHQRFFRIAITLARSGFVVVAPLHTAFLPTPELTPAMIDAAKRDIEWIRTGWHWAPWVRPRGTPISAMGHSYGAIQAARIAIGWPEVGALVALSGPFLEPNDAPQIFANIRCPSLFMFSGQEDFEQVETNTSGSPNNFWRTIPADHYAAIFQGRHFDYLEPSQSGSAPRGPCTLIGRLAAELSTLFLATTLRPLTFVPTSLRKPQVSLTEAQQNLAVQYMTTIDRPWGDPCRIQLKWKVQGSQDSRWIG